MKKITLPQGTIRVDETAKIKDGDFVLDTMDNIVLQPKSGVGEYYRRLLKNIPTTKWIKVVASEYPYCIDKDIPMYKEDNDVEELAIKCGKEYQHLDGDVLLDHPEYYSGFYDGFHHQAAQQKCCYTEEDIINFLSWIGTEGIKEMNDLPSISVIGVAERGKREKRIISRTNKEWFKLYKQSLKGKVEFEVEYKLIDRGSDVETTINIPFSRDGYYQKIKTTRDENVQLWCYLKKK